MAGLTIWMDGTVGVTADVIAVRSALKNSTDLLLQTAKMLYPPVRLGQCDHHPANVPPAKRCRAEYASLLLLWAGPVDTYLDIQKQENFTEVFNDAVVDLWLSSSDEWAAKNPSLPHNEILRLGSIQRNSRDFIPTRAIVESYSELIRQRALGSWSLPKLTILPQDFVSWNSSQAYIASEKLHEVGYLMNTADHLAGPDHLGKAAGAPVQ